MSEMKKSDSQNYSSVDATYVIRDIDGRASSFTISGTLQEDLITEIKSIIHNYIQKSRLTLSNSSSFAQAVIMPLEDSTSGEQTKKEDLSEQTNKRGNYNNG